MKKYFKLNQTVYHPIYGEGKVIAINYKITVNFKNSLVNIFFTLDGRKNEKEPITLSQNPIPEIVNKPLEDEYISFTFEDDLLGEYIEHKKDRRKGIVTYQGHAGVYTGDTFISYKDLLNHWQFTDKKPCGKLAK